MTKVNR